MIELAPDFPIFTASGKRWYDLGDEAYAIMAAEIRRELGRRVTLYANRIADGRMLEMEAAIARGIFEAIAADCDGKHDPEGPAWAVKVEALRDELTTRRKAYPDAIASGRLDPDDGKRQLEILEALLGVYWNHGWHMGGIPAARTEGERRRAWAIAQGFDADSQEAADAHTTGDWSKCPKLEHAA